MKVLFVIFLILNVNAFAKNVAKVKMLRGKVFTIDSENKKSKLTKGMWVNEGDTISTEKKSFVRLSFIDKSTVNVGPDSKMIIEKFSKDKAGVLNIIQGKIRAKVTKDYLDMDQSQSKLFVKSKAAVMGIRGTDFAYIASKNGKAASAVLFEGRVFFSKLQKSDNMGRLESIVSRGRAMSPGQVSVASEKFQKATIPTKMNMKQFKALEKDVNFSNEQVSKQKHQNKSKVPEGLDGDIVTLMDNDIKENLAAEMNVDIGEMKKVDTEGTKLEISEDGVKPPAGSIIHIDSGEIMPMGTNATFDSNTGEWINPDFIISANGEITPPEGFQIEDNGTIIQEAANGDKKMIVNDIQHGNFANINDMQAVAINEDGSLPAAPINTDQISPSGNIANPNDWFVPPALVGVPPHLQSGGGAGTTSLRVTFTKTP